MAVPNPLAREIVDAVAGLGLGGQVVFEPGKCHPKDWANPGRVRVLLKEDGKVVGGGRVKNSMLPLRCLRGWAVAARCAAPFATRGKGIVLTQ